MKLFLALTILTFTVSCARTEKQLVDSSKREAMYHLTKGSCSKAKEALDQVDYQTDDSEYIRLYSDVYGCRAGYSQLSTVVNNLSSVSANATDLFRTLAAFPSSQEETAADSTAYTNLQLAITELLKGGTAAETSATARIAKFGERGAGDMHFQALFLILIQMGKFLKYHGDTDANGVKGAGAGTIDCLFQYTDGTAITYINGGADSCDVGTVGNTSAETLVAAASYIPKMCELIILFNNLRDILANITFSSNSSELGDTVNIGSVLDQAIVFAEGTLSEPAVTTYKNILGQTACETQATSESNNAEEGQRYVGAVLENLHQ